jgi:hypothetical protein
MDCVPKTLYRGENIAVCCLVQGLFLTPGACFTTKAKAVYFGRL